MSAQLTNPLIVPEFNNGKITLYTPDPTTGEPTVNPNYPAIDLQTVLNTLSLGNRTAAPNCCALYGVDLWVTLSSSDCQAIIKLPGYLTDPTTAVAKAFVFTLYGSGYVGLAFDAEGNLYTAEGSYPNNEIVCYSSAAGAVAGSNPAGNNYGEKTTIGNAGITSYFGDLVFDSAGNLWVADYYNHRVVAFDAVGLANNTNTYHALVNPPAGPLPVANTDSTLKISKAKHLFTEPEGLDFDGFGSNANLWVANNNDGNGLGGISNPLTTLVKITPALQAAVLATQSGGTVGVIGANATTQIVPNTNCFIYQVPASTDDNNAGLGPQFGGLQVDKATNWLYVNEEGSAPSNGSSNSAGRAYDLATIAATPDDPTDSLLNITSTNPGNGGLALIGLGAFVADTSTDQGYQPDTTAGEPPVCWESPAISVIQDSLGPQKTLPVSENVTGGDPCFLYVEVQNFGARPTLGIETLDLYWGKASVGLGWPKPWDGTEVDAPPYQTSPMGGVIVATGVTIPVIQPFESCVVGPTLWQKTPNPLQYTVKDGHFCLLARIITTPLLGANGMSFPEGNNIVTNTVNNARIAWRNIHIINGPGRFGNPPAVIVANYTGAAMAARLTFEVLDAKGEMVRSPSGHFHIEAQPDSHAALARSSLGAVWREREEGRVALPAIGARIDRLTLKPNERVTFTVDYKPDILMDAYALRVSQFAKTSDGERLVGGQTFVKGHVAGFRVQPSKR